MSDPLTTEDLDRIAHCAATWGAVSEPDVAKLVAEVRRLKALDTKPEPTIAELAAELQRVKAAVRALFQVAGVSDEPAYQQALQNAVNAMERP